MEKVDKILTELKYGRGPLCKAYRKVSREVGCYREKFTKSTANMERCKLLIGPDYAHVSVDDIRGCIIDACKNPKRYGKEWAAAGKKAPEPTMVSNEYADYLNTDTWKTFAARVREYWGNRCALCNSRKQPLEVHHRTYERFRHEEFTDCIPLCNKCHKRHHRHMPEPMEFVDKRGTLFT